MSTIKETLGTLVGRLVRNWWVHNLVAHPLMQLVTPFSVELACKIHDDTLPKQESKPNL